MNSMNRRCAPIAAGALTLLAAAGGAHAQCTITRNYVPDIDQRRSVLPNMGGMYCVPVSAINWMGYLANSGYVSMMGTPTPQNWQADFNYLLVNSRINIMAGLMGTDGVNGTGGTGAFNGLKYYFNIYMPGRFTVAHSGANGLYSPNPGEFYNNMAMGGLVNMCYGFYSQSGNQFTRTGGHCITLNSVTACSANPTVSWRDPATDSADLAHQSLFATQTSAAVPAIAWWRGGPNSPYEGRTQWGLQALGNGRYIDEKFVIWPIYGLGPTTTFGVPLLEYIGPVAVAGEPTLNFQVSSPGGAPILDCEPHPYSGKALVVTGPQGTIPPKLWEFNPVDRTFTERLTLRGPGPIALDRFGSLFLTDGGVIKKVGFEPNGEAQEIVQRTPPESPIAMIYDDSSDEIIAVTPSGRMLRFADDLGAPPWDEPLPPGMVLGGQRSLAVGPDGEVWITSTESRAIYKIGIDEASGRPVLAQTLVDPSIVGPTGLNITEDGHVMFVSGGVLHELAQGVTGAWGPFEGSIFAGRAAGQVFKLSRSRTNFTPDMRSGPGDTNVLPTEFADEVPDCNADFNHDGVLNSGDFFDFLSAFFDGHADFNFDGETSSQDFFDYLTAFFAGCA